MLSEKGKYKIKFSMHAPEISGMELKFFRNIRKMAQAVKSFSKEGKILHTKEPYE
jgi:hypothetical protein